MAASSLVQALNLIFWARKQAVATQSTAQEVLDAITLCAGAGFADSGSRLISTSVNGKSVSFSPDPDLTISDLMEALREADAILALYNDAQIARMLATPRQSTAQISFR